MSAHVLWYLGIGYPSPCKRHVHPEVARMGFVRNRDQYASVRGGFLSLFPAAYGVHSPADAPALTSQGSDFLSPFPRPAKAGHMVGVAQQEERRSAKPCVAGSNPAPTSTAHTLRRMPEVGIS